MKTIETKKMDLKAKYTDKEIEEMAEAYRIYLKNKIVEWFYATEIGPEAGFRKLLEIVISEFYVPVEYIDV